MGDLIDDDSTKYLKLISRVKHHVLENYFKAWANIVGKHFHQMFYFDCFAGGGIFHDEMGQPLPGSPVRILRLAKEHVQRHPSNRVVLGFVEKNSATEQMLRRVLEAEGPLPRSLRYRVGNEAAEDYVQRLIEEAEHLGPETSSLPMFFFVDPFGHPITIKHIQRLLAFGRTEVLVTLMTFRFIMDIHNPRVSGRLDHFFGHPDWRTQPFMSLGGPKKEDGFVEYFKEQVGTRYFALDLPVPFSVEDRVPGWDSRNKYYLVHFSSHKTAAKIMKEVMSDGISQAREVRRTRTTGEKQLPLFDNGPTPGELRNELLRRFAARRITFDEILLETPDLRFAEKHYRIVLHDLEKEGAVRVERVDSKETGITGRDIVAFP